MSKPNKFLRENKVSKMSKAERNAWFNALPKPDKAVAVCEDILLQIKNEKYVMTSGTYIQLQIADNITQRTVNDIIKKEALDEVVAAKSVTCNVCAIGSAFMSCVRLGNQVSTEAILGISNDNKDSYGYNEIEAGNTIAGNEFIAMKKLEEVFTKKEFRAMEFIFEDGYDVNYTFLRDEVSALYKHYSKQYSGLNEEERMIKMCKQIIKDKGYFLVEGVDLENKNK